MPVTAPARRTPPTASLRQLARLLRSGTIAPADDDQDACVYHQDAPWLADEQPAACSLAAPQGGPELCLSVPLGAHGLGDDPWRHRDVFVSGACGGAPPDAVFTQGQTIES